MSICLCNAHWPWPVDGRIWRLCRSHTDCIVECQSAQIHLHILQSGDKIGISSVDGWHAPTRILSVSICCSCVRHAARSNCVKPWEFAHFTRFMTKFGWQWKKKKRAKVTLIVRSEFHIHLCLANCEWHAAKIKIQHTLKKPNKYACCMQNECHRGQSFCMNSVLASHNNQPHCEKGS